MNDEEYYDVDFYAIPAGTDLNDVPSIGLYSCPEPHEPEFIDPDPVTMAKLKAYIESGQYMRDVMRKVEERMKG